MPFQIDFSSAESIRNGLMITQKRRIESLYKRVARNIQKEIKNLPDVPSAPLKKQYLENLAKKVDIELKGIQSSLRGEILGNMYTVADAVTWDNNKFLESIGFPLQGDFSYVNKSAVESVISGRIYKGDWSLSKALWGTTKKTQTDLRTVIAEGIAQNKSIYDIAKDLEKYVDPAAKKEWDWSKVYPGTSKKVDYNAQRLARTMVAHAYQQSFVQSTIKNPFVTKYKWLSSGARTCEICADRDGQYYDKDDLPIDHPNGMCTYVAVIDQPMTAVADRIADWALGGSDPELDIFEEYLKGK